MGQQFQAATNARAAGARAGADSRGQEQREPLKTERQKQQAGITRHASTGYQELAHAARTLRTPFVLFAAHEDPQLRSQFAASEKYWNNSRPL